MIERRDTTIEVDMVPNSSEIKWVYPLIKDLAIYWSSQKRRWFVSCRCTEEEATGNQGDVFWQFLIANMSTMDAFLILRRIYRFYNGGDRHERYT